jgi:hypothetical protein
MEVVAAMSLLLLLDGAAPTGFTTDLATDIGQFRLEIGDTTEPALFTDAEASYFLTAGGSVRLAVTRAVEALAVRFARAYDTTIDGQSFRRSQIAAALEKRAGVLAGSHGPVEVAYVTRIDGYSDDIPASDTRATHSTGRQRSSWDLCGYDLEPDRDIPA